MVREVNRQLLLFAARAVARIRPLRDPRVLVPALLHAAIHAVPFTLRVALAAVPATARAARGVVRLLLLLLFGLGRLLAALVRRLGAALLRAHRAIDYRALARRALMAGALAGAVLLIAADFSAVREVTVLTVVRERVHGGSEHFFALAVLGVVALPLIWGAGTGGSRPAMRTLAAIGLVALVVVLAVDLPRLGHTEGLALRYDDASGGAGPGFDRELAGALLLVACGLGLLRLAPRRPRRARRARRPEVTRPTSPSAPVA